MVLACPCVSPQRRAGYLRLPRFACRLHPNEWPVYELELSSMGSTSGLQASTLTLRQPPNSSEPPSGTEVKLKHPGYNDRKNTLLSLLGLDKDGERVGLHLRTASTICAIISGRQDGFFTEGRDGPPLVRLEDDLLEQGTYYYHVPDDPQYAIYPSFDHWPFPHDNLPESYKQAAPHIPNQTNMTGTTQAVLNRDERCLVSGSRDKQVLQRAHLCPKGTSTLLVQNDMSEYNQFPYLTGDSLTEDVANAITLRQDIHQAFDSRLFAIVQKKGVWATHFLKPTFDLGREYHNVQITINQGVSTQFLYARLAWSIFPLVRPFLQSSTPRWVHVRIGHGDWHQEELGMSDINTKIFPSRSGSESPTKRSRTGGNGPADDAGVYSTKRNWSSASQSNEEADQDAPTQQHKRRKYIQNYDVLRPRSMDVQRPVSPPNSRPPSPTKADNDFINPLPAYSDSGNNAESVQDARLSWEQEELEKYFLSEEYAAIESLRRRELVRRRPRYDDTLFCCNYEEHEDEQKALLHGFIEDGDCEHHLCVDCDR